MTLKSVLILLVGLAVILWLSGCANTATDGKAICDSIDRAALADAVLADGGKKSQSEALFVLDQLNAAC